MSMIGYALSLLVIVSCLFAIHLICTGSELPGLLLGFGAFVVNVVCEMAYIF